MLNLLAQNGTLGYGVKAITAIDLNWIGKLIRILIEGIGIVGVGIIVFTLILKTIVLPLDIYSRIKGKKQALVMERMRPQMEKLQKQYADDKTMYNQKVMELQKASGYSMFGACLPMIVSLVIFIIVFNAFSTYSQYANLQNYNDMVHVYNGVVQTYVITDDNQSGFLTEVKDEDGAVIDYVVDFAKFTAKYSEERGVNYATEEEAFVALAKEYKADNTGFEGAFNENTVNNTEGGELTEAALSLRNTLVSYFLERPAAQKVYEYYLGVGEYEGQPHNNQFLWVKNLWYPDSTLNKGVPNFDKFKSTVTKANIGADYAESYDKVTYYLRNENPAYLEAKIPGNQANGYFILIVLSIGLMLLQQFISMRANKSVNELSTVDGSGSRTNKWMLIMMPIIYGIFSFFYSASFSLYMITNTVYGLVTMLIINKCVDVWFKKKEEAGELDKILNKKKKVKTRQPGGNGGNRRRK